MPTLISAYTLSYQNWTVIPHQIEEDLAEMAACGFNAVALSYSESDDVYGYHTFARQVRMIQSRGMRALAIPSRIGGRMAGAPLMPSLFLAAHPECGEPGPQPVTGPLACLHSPLYREHLRKLVRTLVADHGVDGIIWDEPKGTKLGSSHPDTIAALGRPGTPADTAVAYRDLLSELNLLARSLRPELSITLFAQDTDPPGFTQVVSRAAGLNFHGYDGNLAPQWRRSGEVGWFKYRIDDPRIRARFAAEAEAAGLGTFALVENMLTPASSHGIYETNLEAYLSGPLPDHLSVYYYGHDNEDPEGLHAITRRLMRRHLR